MSIFEPNIVGFLCNWCSYAGADLAGVSRIQYPTNMRVIKVMCSGRVEPGMVLEFLEAGADGVMVTGCHIGDCHYISGNLHTKRKYALLQKLLAKTGLEPQRIRLEWNSAAEWQRFANLVKEFTEQVRVVGPTPLKTPAPDAARLLNIRAAREAADGFRLRALVGKEEKLVTTGNVYGDKVAQDEFTKAMDDAKEPLKVYPLPHQPVVKDLVADLKNFYAQYASIEPWLHTTTPTPEKEWKQSYQDRAKLDGTYECSLCACCAAAGPS